MPVVCDDSDACTADSCDPATGCLFAALSCDDGDPCTSPDICSAGACRPGPDICGGPVTVMVYMAADNNLDPFALEDWKEMEDAHVDDADWLRVFVLIDRASDDAWSDTCLYEIHNGASTELDGPNLGITAGASADELNMGHPDTLANFIRDVKARVGGGSYYLILWNHGDGWRGVPAGGEKEFVPKLVCGDDTSDDWLYTKELQAAIAGQGLSLLGIDACIEGLAEIAYEVRHDAQVMVASEELEPGEGWNYLGLLGQFKTAADPNPFLFGQLAVDTFFEVLSYDDITLAVYDLSRLDELAAACDGMAGALSGLNDTDWRNLCRDNDLEWFGIIRGMNPYLTDLYQLAVEAMSVDPANTAAYDGVLQVLDGLVYYELHGSSRPNAHGLAIYFKCRQGASTEYAPANLQWAADTIWDDMLLARRFAVR